MNKQRKTSHILNVFQYDADGHVVLPASLTLGIAPAGNDNSGKVGTTAWVRTYVSGLSYQGAITLTVSGTSGAATLVGNTLNIPTYTLAGLGGQAALNGTGFVKISGTTISYDNNTYATETYVGTAIANLVDSSPATLDTLNELAAALGDDPNFATTVATSIGTKQAQLNGTGFVKVTGTTVSYDNSTYALDSAVVKLAGTQTITGVKTFTGAGNTFTQNANFQGRIFLKSDSTTNYTNLGGHTNQLLVGVIGATHILSFPENTNYTYTFPAASGTLAFTSNLSSYVPYTGGTANVNLGVYDLDGGNININGAGSGGGALRLKQFGSSEANREGYNSISTLTSGVFYFTSSASVPNFKNFALNPSGLADNTLRTYALPDASGTIALTSNLSSYLPLTGGTLSTTNTTETLRVSNGGTGYALYVQSDAYFQGDLKLQGSLKSPSYTFTLPNATGTLALTSDLSSYVPTSRTITINGTTLDLSANRSWSVGTIVGNSNILSDANGSNVTVNGGYFTGFNPTNVPAGQSSGDWGVMNFPIWTGNSSGERYAVQLAANIDDNAQIFIRKFKFLNTVSLQTWYALLHSGNFSSYALPLSGGIMTGDIQMGNNQNRIIKFRTATAWDYSIRGINDDLFITDNSGLNYIGCYYNGGGGNRYISLMGMFNVYPNGVVNSGNTINISGQLNASGRIHAATYGNASRGSILMGVENNTENKWSYLLSTQYNSSTNPTGYALIGGYTSATENRVIIGGSIYEANPATSIEFWTHSAVTHATGGSLKMTITSAGTLQPAGNGTQDLGTSSLRWSTVFTSDLSLSNGIGDYTIVEGENDLFLYNNKQNKVYKFMLAEVDPADATPKKS